MCVCCGSCVNINVVTGAVGITVCAATSACKMLVGGQWLNTAVAFESIVPDSLCVTRACAAGDKSQAAGGERCGCAIG